LTKKVVVRIFGGLGNQLFCYAVAKKIAINNNADLIIDNTSGFKKDIYNRKYLLNNFNIQSRLANKYEFLYPFTRYRYSILRRFNKLLKFKNRIYIQHEGVDFDKRVLQIKVRKILYLEGCWQSENYFLDIQDIIKNEFKLNIKLNNENTTYLNLIKNTNSVCLHIRFFDNKETGPNNISESYYINAINFLKYKISNPTYFIFSDNVQLAQKKLKFIDTEVYFVNINSSNEAAIYDFNLMKNCKNFIIANSTFSWWAAWLSDNNEKIVIAPDYVIAKSKETITSWGFDGLIPHHWIKLK
jgi:hypothetical protein